MAAVNLGDISEELTVVKDGGTKRKVKHWWCLCGRCGRVELIPAGRIKSMGCCTICRRGPCVVCGREILRGRSTACSPECRKIKTQAKNNRSLAKRLFQNPNYHKDAYQSVKRDPSRAAKRRARQALVYQLRQECPRLRAQTAASKSAYHAEHREENAARHRRWRENLPIEARLDLRRRRAEYSREYRQALKSDPSKYQAFLLDSRAYHAERRRLAELAKFSVIAGTLQEKLDE